MHKVEEWKSMKNGFPNNSYFIKKITPPGLSDDHTYFLVISPAWE